MLLLLETKDKLCLNPKAVDMNSTQFQHTQLTESLDWNPYTHMHSNWLHIGEFFCPTLVDNVMRWCKPQQFSMFKITSSYRENWVKDVSERQVVFTARPNQIVYFPDTPFQ